MRVVVKRPGVEFSESVESQGTNSHRGEALYIGATPVNGASDALDGGRPWSEIRESNEPKHMNRTSTSRV